MRRKITSKRDNFVQTSLKRCFYDSLVALAIEITLQNSGCNMSCTYFSTFGCNLMQGLLTKLHRKDFNILMGKSVFILMFFSFWETEEFRDNAEKSWIVVDQ